MANNSSITDQGHKRQPAVLVGIVSYNRSEILPKALVSALAQSYSAFNVAVTDDASTDKTYLLKDKFQQVDWKFCKTKEGYLKARNDFMFREGYDYFVSLDDDSWFLKGDEISLAIQYLEENMDTGAVAFDIISPDKSKTTDRRTPYQTSMYIGCGHVVRLSIVRKLGGYAQLPGFYGGEEKDLCIRLLDTGFKTMFMPGVHVWHDKTQVSRSIPRQHASGVCNDFAFTLRRTPLNWLLPLLVLKVFNHLKFSIVNGLTLACIKGLLMVLRDIRLIIGNRDPVKIETIKKYRSLTARVAQ